MRRRTKTIGIGKGRVVIYIAVIAAIWMADYVYTNYIEPKRQQIEEQLEQHYASQTSNNQKSENSNESKAQGKTLRAGWAELPATSKQKQLHTALHLCDDGLRNYSACFSSEYHCPVWVAAPLHRSYKGEVKRSDSFTFDPTIPARYQPQITRSYGEYTRGHLLGSAERTASQEMNEQTFYATNIAPQLRDGFNARGGAWNNIERMVDRQICSDTLYVVTGCIFEDYTHTDGSKVKASTTTNRSDGMRIGVPTAYYKAMLRTKRGSTGKSVMECSAEELKCAAIIVPHISAAGYKPSKQDLISIKELERLSGLEFFTNVKNAPKSKASASDWGL